MKIINIMKLVGILAVLVLVSVIFSKAYAFDKYQTAIGWAQIGNGVPEGKRDSYAIVSKLPLQGKLAVAGKKVKTEGWNTEGYTVTAYVKTKKGYCWIKMHLARNDIRTRYGLIKSRTIDSISVTIEGDIEMAREIFNDPDFAQAVINAKEVINNSTRNANGRYMFTKLDRDYSSVIAKKNDKMTYIEIGSHFYNHYWDAQTGDDWNNKDAIIAARDIDDFKNSGVYEGSADPEMWTVLGKRKVRSNKEQDRIDSGIKVESSDYIPVRKDKIVDNLNWFK